MAILTPCIVTMEDAIYHADPCPEPSLSGSVAIPLVHQSPKHAWTKHVRLNADYEAKTSVRAEFGSAAHAMLLGSGKPVVFLDFPDFKTKAAQSARDDAILNGNIVLLVKDQPTLDAMMVVAREYISACGVDLSKGKPEQALFWREVEVWCRGKVDWLSDDLRLVLDYKTTGISARPEDMGKSLFDQDYHLKAAFYERGLNVLDPDSRNIGRRKVLFFYQEITPPYACSLINISEAGMTIGRKQATYAIDRWKACMRTKMWPAYGVGISTVTPPPWIERAWLEREMLDDTMTGATNPDGYVAPYQPKQVNTGD